MPRPHQNPQNRPPHVLMPDGPDVEEFNVSHIHIRQQRGLQVAPLDGHEPEQTLRRASHILRNISAYGPIKQEPVWWIGVGTALGFSREKGFIKGDTDIDIRILLDDGDRDTALRTLADLVATFEPNGFRLVRESYWRTIPMQAAFVDRETGNVVDFYFFHRQAGKSTYVNYNERGYREKPAHLVDNRRSLSWPGHPDIIVNVPHPVEEYNAWRFGPNWRTPKKNSELTAEDLQCIRALPELVVLTYGTFDLLHFGHHRLLERAAVLGDRLVVGVVSDALCAIKGKPIVQNEATRLAAVAALPYVDETFVQVEMEQKERDIDRFGASLIVVGDDWFQHPRFEKVRGYNDVEISYLKRTKFISSTLLRRLRWLLGGV